MAGEKTSAKRRATRSAAKPYAIDLTAARDFAAAHLPGAEVNGKFGGASFFVGGKVFAFTRPKGLVLKVPADAMAELLATRGAQHLVMGKRVMREWALLSLRTPDSYVEELRLLQVAMAFVQSLEARRTHE